jgi:hypothetical protein
MAGSRAISLIDGPAARRKASRLLPRELEDNMQAFGVLLLAAATAGDGLDYHQPGVHLKQLLRPHAVVAGHTPGPPPYTAATLAGGAGAAPGRRFVTTKSQIYFLDPNGMQVGWQNGTGPQGERTYLPAQLTVPARYNFNQGYIYRLKITNIPGRLTAALYPTIEVAPTTPLTDAYLAHNAIPVQLTAEDFDQVIDGGNFVTKVIYLPDPKYQELAVSGVETLVSTRLEPGVDPILEADKRGTILLIVRLGAIDLENPPAPVVGGALGGPLVGAPTELPPGALPPGATVVTPPAQPTVILDNAPVPGAPAPALAPAPAPAPGTAPAPAPAPPGAAPAPAPVPAPPAPGAPVRPRTASLAPAVSAPEVAAVPGS